MNQNLRERFNMRECRTVSTKRLFDLLLAVAGLLVSVPLWALIAIVIKFEDGGPVFYGQERVGKGGARFRIWKFRSMTLSSVPQFSIYQAECNDKRVTTVGRILRATGMDELPQLWNIFKGEMSFVGPRPLLAEEIEVEGPDEIIQLADVPGYVARHQVLPGLTGLAQVFASRYLPRRQKFRFDLLYIRKQSFLIDLKCIGLSFWIVLRGKCGEPWVRSRPIARKAHRSPATAYYSRPVSSGVARIRTVIEQ
jgi:lipopolysaccharide/colanic/teichoic acid biosynthesis glycosyltransferase